MKQQIALTFDDGPSEWTEGILDTLADHGARATFFVIGSVAARRAEVLTRAAVEGHEIGNHTWSHPWLARDCDNARIRDELEQTNSLIADLLGTTPKRFRAPHYNVDERVVAIAAECGLEHTRGDVTPPDWHPSSSAAFIATLVLQRVKPGLIVGLHDGVPPHRAGQALTRQPTADAVAAVISRLRARGFDCVTATELLRSAEA